MQCQKKHHIPTHCRLSKIPHDQISDDFACSDGLHPAQYEPTGEYVVSAPNRNSLALSSTTVIEYAGRSQPSRNMF